MQQKHASSAVFVGVFLVIMCLVFVKFGLPDAHKTTPFSISSQNIAYGYPQGVDGCRGGSPNGTVVQYEECDDGNMTAGDGCQNNCTLTTGYSCTGSPSSCSTTCGDGIKAGAEGCDDSNTASGDGCSNLCVVQSGFSCSGTAPTVCAAVCGDGTKVGNEGCDDGNTTSSDGCSSACAVESGYLCSGTPSSCSTVCGDGIKTGGEACDDGNASNSDGCSSSCTIESGYSCTGSPSSCVTGCGDNIVAGAEQCDPGTVGGQTASCNSDCTLSVCGDSKLNTLSNEECDNGSGNANTSTCNTSCLKTTCGDSIVQFPNGYGVGEQCEPSLNSTCTNQCNLQVSIGTVIERTESDPIVNVDRIRLSPSESCGNSKIEPEFNESCDEGIYNGLSPLCDRWCQTKFCGNGLVEPENGEECEPDKTAFGTFVSPMCGKSCSTPTCDDLGNCAGGCTLDFLQACTTQDVAAFTEAIKVPEIILLQSPDYSRGEDVGGDVIVASFYDDVGGSIPTTSSVPNFSSLSQRTNYFEQESQDMQRSASRIIPPGCGDGVIGVGEQCDEGRKNSDSRAGACRTTCVLSYCGDSVLDSGEECDRGLSNNIIGNGCTPICKKSICGNALLEPGEECDRGVANSDTEADACSTKCLLPRCGDAIIDTAFGETCDDGLRNSDSIPSACRKNCVQARCGDGVRDEGEECDSGSNNSDTASGACRLTCTLPKCGDRIVDIAEQCDDGPSGSPLCAPNCKSNASFINALPSLSAPSAVLLYLSLVIGGGIVVRQLSRAFRSL